MRFQLAEWFVLLKLVHHRRLSILDGIALGIGLWRSNAPA